MRLKLQITTAEHSVLRSWAKTSRNPGLIDVIDLNHINNILAAIKGKCKYPADVQKELILLIYSFKAKFEPEFLQSEIQSQWPENSFKAIYFVELPKKDPRYSYPLYSGNMIQLSGETKNSDIF